MTSHRGVPILFYISAVYDGILGAMFLVAGPAVFRVAAVTPPNHWAYIHFPAALLLIFALMFWSIARDPRGNRNLIVYGILLKVAYCAVAGGYWIAAGIPGIWKPFVFVDGVFIVLFIAAWRGIAARGV